MLVADTYLGNLDDEILDDDALATRVERAEPLVVTVDETERRRSRFRTTAADGTDLGVVVARDLCDGDVLDADGTLVVVELADVEAMVLDFDGVAGDAATVTTALELGHAVGNRHWDLAVEGTSAYIPVTDARERMEREIRPRLPDDVGIDHEAVPPTLFDEGTAGPGHAHAGEDHSHASSHSPGDHTHAVRTLDPEGEP